MLLFLVSILALRKIKLMVKLLQRSLVEADRIIGFPVAIMDEVLGSMLKWNKKGI